MQLDFQKKRKKNLESISFHYEMFDVTSFRLVLGVYIVHVVIFIKKYQIYLFRIFLCDLLREGLKKTIESVIMIVAGGGVHG